MTEHEAEKLQALHRAVKAARGHVSTVARQRDAYVVELAERYPDVEIADVLGLRRQRIGAMKAAGKQTVS